MKRLKNIFAACVFWAVVAVSSAFGRNGDDATLADFGLTAAIIGAALAGAASSAYSAKKNRDAQEDANEENEENANWQNLMTSVAGGKDFTSAFARPLPETAGGAAADSIANSLQQAAQMYAMQEMDDARDARRSERDLATSNAKTDYALQKRIEAQKMMKELGLGPYAGAYGGGSNWYTP